LWFNKVDLPMPLLNAQNEGKLVIFAGAGVSRSAPSNYPDFDGLVKQVISRCGNILTREEKEPADRFLGRLAKQGPKVHEIVRDILSCPDSRPNDLHYNLLSLFRQHGEVRIVTTNFDTHFSTVANEVFGGKVPIYRAPALPPGHRFYGIVYLHGSVDDQTGDMVLTDSDFGLAYLTEGWATNFLKGLFGQYVVLFVGYSHNDLIMEYLGRGLSPGTPRFALVPGDEDQWRFRGIEPIVYPNDEGDHRELLESVKAWAIQTRMSLVDQEERIKRIVQTAPPLDPEEVSYVQAALEDEVTARIFTRYAVLPEWLRWVEDQGLLTPSGI